ncbi:type A2 lanthipeptide [Halalkalibacter alkalisediminis]|uniref:Lantibiotic n=1 Tax=Halalkalibacter alkalisediminis TaxID=935616 RepID=A0ABV6NK78_9BACI|nr:type A2 lanthipeptide [Halalkalibacter alkalisediminis]
MTVEQLALSAIEDVTDAELELMVGGSGLIPTVTKDCPNFVSSVCVGFGFISGCKDCK